MFRIACVVLLGVVSALPQNRFRNQQDQSNQFEDQSFSAGNTGGTANVRSLEDAGILRMENVNNEDGSFNYGFETADGIQQDVAGQIKQIGEEFGVVMQGSYSYVAPDENGQDKTYTVTWTADENGFQAEGDGIPGAPQVNQAGSFQPEDQFNADRGGQNRFN